MLSVMNGILENYWGDTGVCNPLNNSYDYGACDWRCHLIVDNPEASGGGTLSCNQLDLTCGTPLGWFIIGAAHEAGCSHLLSENAEERYCGKVLQDVCPETCSGTGNDAYAFAEPLYSCIYENSDLMVMPTLDESKKRSVEGFGIAYIEAAFFGVPSIASNIGGTSEAVIDKSTGIIINSVNDLYGSIKDLLSDKNKRIFIGQNAQKRSIDELNWENVCKNYLKAFSKVVPNLN